MTGTLYVVGTPIGNLEDMPERAVGVLRSVDVCYAEDTRRTGTLLGRLDANVPLRSLHKHNERARVDELLAALGAGRSVALVSDAGTPTVSDPGCRAVAAAREAGHEVLAVPGPSAVLAALSVSGFPAERFRFLGFVPRRGGERSAWIDDLRACTDTAVAFEAPGRLVALLDELTEAGLGERAAVVCRELTKLHEETTAGSVRALASAFAAREVRGEVTVVFEGGAAGNEAPDLAVLMEEARHWSRDGLRRREIADRLAAEFGLSRNEAYRVSLQVQEAPSE
ncbi:16S rRNA (cytidine(1402)-2'-O)-methyltransferase [Candidatus Palauibacter irciniicola]|uniref:16S rRNA (cytidine(1402)-2'-O)-methyltransferase n=1 Tax=Candidatus Palauibacter irciniicola TaxID=3056733 RepID=UPI003B023189